VDRAATEGGSRRAWSGHARSRPLPGKTKYSSKPHSPGPSDITAPPERPSANVAAAELARKRLDTIGRLPYTGAHGEGHPHG
jgi:hypothetical protein